MMIQLHRQAEEELFQAVRWYDDQVSGLGDDLLIEVEHWLDVIPDTPLTWPLWPGARKLDPPVRRAVLKRFPFAIAYQALEDRLLVLAFAHTSRRPLYWSNRADTGPG
jgi:hypothetical protein